MKLIGAILFAGLAAVGYRRGFPVKSGTGFILTLGACMCITAATVLLGLWLQQ
jgi:hypothetical protein